jgi:hypothetical protein
VCEIQEDFFSAQPARSRQKPTGRRSASSRCPYRIVSRLAGDHQPPSICTCFGWPRAFRNLDRARLGNLEPASAPRRRKRDFFARQILPPIYRWFMPKLAAYSEVLSRVHEFAADHQALTCASDSTPDLMLIRIGLAGQFLAHRFWPEIWKGTHILPCTPSVVFSRLPECAKSVSSSDIHEWIKVLLSQESNPLDSHPDTSTPLKALESTVDTEEWTRTVEEFGLVPESTAASEYCGTSLPRYEQLLTEQWVRGSFLIWEDAFRNF